MSVKEVHDFPAPPFGTNGFRLERIGVVAVREMAQGQEREQDTRECKSGTRRNRRCDALGTELSAP
jgi:hypothetical protein